MWTLPLNGWDNDASAYYGTVLGIASTVHEETKELQYIVQVLTENSANVNAQCERFGIKLRLLPLPDPPAIPLDPCQYPVSGVVKAAQYHHHGERVHRLVVPSRREQL